MARKSRVHVPEGRNQAYRVWRIAVYIRLSKEDARNLDESESVTNQRAIIEEHIAGFNDGDEYIIVDEYVDDGISGTTDDERDDFQRMLADVKRGRINCVIVKDLARSFRNYSDQGYYLDDWFPRFNVRFISLYHQPLDSYREPQNMRSIAVPIQGVLNENHCAETSDKVREVFDMKRRNGEFIGAFAAYGWLKDPNNKNALLLDEEAAEVVRSMGAMVLDGMSLNAVVRYLNDHGIPCPSVYKREKLTDAIEQKERELAKIARYKQAIYQDWKDGEITHSDYRHMKEDYESQAEDLNGVMETLRAEQAELEKGVDAENPFLAAVRQSQNVEKLTRDVLIELVDHIKVHEGGNISIVFRFADELRRVQEFIQVNTHNAAV